MGQETTWVKRQQLSIGAARAYQSWAWDSRASKGTRESVSDCPQSREGGGEVQQGEDDIWS